MLAAGSLVLSLAFSPQVKTVGDQTQHLVGVSPSALKAFDSVAIGECKVINLKNASGIPDLPHLTDRLISRLDQKRFSYKKLNSDTENPAGRVPESTLVLSAELNAFRSAETGDVIFAISVIGSSKAMVPNNRGTYQATFYTRTTVGRKSGNATSYIDGEVAQLVDLFIDDWRAEHRTR